MYLSVIGKSYCNWTELSQQVRETFEFSFVYFAESFQAIGLANSLHGLENMEVPHISLNMIKSVLRSLEINSGKFHQTVFTPH